MRENMVDKIEASEILASDYELAADSESTYDKQLSDKTLAVCQALRARAQYIRSRLDA